MLCDDRLEVRFPSDDKSIVEESAREEGVSVSTIIRRAIRAITGQRPPLTLELAQQMVMLRRHLNAIEDSLNRLGLSAAALSSVQADLALARRDGLGEAADRLAAHHGHSRQKDWAKTSPLQVTAPPVITLGKGTILCRV